MCHPFFPDHFHPELFFRFSRVWLGRNCAERKDRRSTRSSAAKNRRGSPRNSRLPSAGSTTRRPVCVRRGGNLVDVDLASDRVSVADADLPCLLALPHLKRLKLSGGGISDLGVRQIGSIAGLEELSLQDARIDDEGLKPLENLKNLSSLTIRRSPRVTDSAIEHLLQLPKLSKLGLLEVGITNRGLERLKGMTRLRGSICADARKSAMRGWTPLP